MAHAHDTVTQNSCPACSYGPFTRNNYFTGKLLVERDFTDETRFHMEKLRHHQQQLHGWGVVCGLKVKPHPNPACRDRFVCIEPGYAVDCCGHDIIVREEECIDLTQFKEIQELKKQNDDRPHTLQICVSFRECPTEEIPVLYDDCGCDDTKCAPNRILESYEVGVILDQKAEPPMLHSPKLKWEHTVSIGHAARVALHDATHRLYVLTADAPGVVYQLSTANHTTITSYNLRARGLALAVSSNGERVYVVTEQTAPSTVRQLHVLDVTKPEWPSINTNPIDVPNSIGSDVVLTVAPDGRLLALVTATGAVVRWGTDIDSQAVPAAGTVIQTLGVNRKAMALSSDGNVLYVAGAPNTLQALNLTTLNVSAASNVLPAASVSALATVKTTESEVLAVADADQASNFLHLVAPSPAALIGSVKLDHSPVALAVSPGGHWVYVLEQDTATQESYVQAVNAQGVRQGLTVNASPKFKVGHPSQQLMLSEVGARLYIPFTGDLETPAVGGVALVDVTEQACSEILWRHLDGCPHCDTPDCVVLATIKNYRIGDRIEDANIDNRKGRRLLPSTQILTELIECLLEHGDGGGGGPQEPPGPVVELTHICDISWRHGEPIKLNSFEGELVLTIAFDRPVQSSDLDSPSLRVLRKQPEKESRVMCWCELQPEVTRKGELQTLCDASSNFTETKNPTVKAVQIRLERSQVSPSDNKPAEFRVTVSGDLIRDEKGKAIDANHLPPWFNTANYHTGNGVAGGTFESWFTIINE